MSRHRNDAFHAIPIFHVRLLPCALCTHDDIADGDRRVLAGRA
jgi:hypothetical protein